MSRPILVTALNPAIDAEWRVSRVQWEEKNTIEAERRWPGGKGVNVARWLMHLKGESRLLVPLGGVAGGEFKTQLKRAGFSFVPVSLREQTRVNIIVTQEAGPQMRFNPRGPKLSSNEWREVFANFGKALRRSSTAVLSGSLPREAAANTYARMVRLAERAGVRALLDCDGPALVAGIKARPFLAKPNQHELAQWCGRQLTSVSAAGKAAVEMSAVSGGWVLVSCGGAGGWLVNHVVKAAWVAAVPQVAVKNSVGAGDALLAAVAQQIEQEAAPEEWLRWGLATGTAATGCVAGILPKRAAINRLAAVIEVKDYSKKLTW